LTRPLVPDASEGGDGSATADVVGVPTMMAAVVVLLGIGLTDTQPNGATVIVIISAVVVGAILAGWRPLPRRLTSSAGVFAAGIGLETYVLAARPVLDHPVHRLLLLALGALAVHAILSPRWRRVEAVLVVAGYAAAMTWMLAVLPVPPSDVILFQQQSVAAFLNGIDPYQIRFENIYGYGTSYYAPELQIGKMLDFGFVYPPFSLLLAVPGYALFGDYRYGALIAIVLTALLMIRTSRAELACGAAFLFLLAPVTPLVLYWGWSEPFLALPFAATVALAVRSSAATPFALGLAIAAKQYAPPLLAIGFVLLESVRRKVGLVHMAVVPLLVAAVTVIPFAIWDPGALVHSAVGVHVMQLFRLDAVSIPSLLARFQLPPTPTILGYVISGAVMALFLSRATRTVPNFCYVTAITVMLFFLFNKQAFMNYYWFVLVAVVLGIAATRFPADVAASPPTARAR
jgi:hypothetical protein